MKLANARLITNDVPALTRFYQAVTGMTPKGDDRYVEFHTQTLTLAISSQRAIDLHAAGATEAVANRSLILDFEVEDVDRERERLSNVVTVFVMEPTTQPWGNRSMLFRDPDGNLINVFAPVRAAVDSAR
jgi:predicted enzyme related to lactoylglutathione lyase